MQVELARLFRADGRFRVDLCPGLMPAPGWVGDVFLSLHCDGAGPTAHGFGFGWPANGRNPGRGPELAARIAKRFLAIPHPGGHHLPDNYTDGERGYYGWGHVSAATKVLIEHAFMTNPSERAWAVSHIPQMAAATHAAVLEHLGLKTPAAVKPRGPRRMTTLDGKTVLWTGRFVSPSFIAALRREIASRGDVRVGNNPKG
jgi:hypothetical protein